MAKKLTGPDFGQGTRMVAAAVSMSPVSSVLIVIRVVCEVRPRYVVLFRGGAAAADAAPRASSPASANGTVRRPACRDMGPSRWWSARRHPHLERSAERDVRVEAQRRMVVGEAEARDAARELLERELRLELAERRPDAEVDPLA